MSSVCSVIALLIAAACAVLRRRCPRAPPLRVCADPNNLPFSNAARRGIRKQDRRLVARDLHRPLDYFWSPQRRGFIRNTLNAGRCDVMIGVPARLRATAADPRLLPLVLCLRVAARSRICASIRSTIARLRDADDRHPDHRRRLQQSAGRAGAGRPAHLEQRARLHRLRRLLQAGSAARHRRRRRRRPRRRRGGVGTTRRLLRPREPTPLDVDADRCRARRPSAAVRFDIAMGVRRDDAALRDALDAIIARRGAEMRQILTVLRSAAAMTASQALLGDRGQCAARSSACGRTPPSGGTTRRAAADVHGSRPGSRSARIRRAARPRPNPYARGSHGHGRGTPAVRPLQLLGLPWRSRRRRHGPEPARRRLDLRERDAQLFSSIAEGRAHGMPSWQPRLTADQIWKLVTYIKSLRTRNEPQPPPTNKGHAVCRAVASQSCLARRSRVRDGHLLEDASTTPAKRSPARRRTSNRPPQAGAARAQVQRSAVGR